MNIIEVQCATAGGGYSPFPMSAEFHSRAKATGETFYCPAGHSLTYGEGNHRREVRLLRERIERYENQIRDMEEELLTAWRTCPWVGCHFVSTSDGRWSHQGRQRHMRAIHGMPTLAEVRSLSEAS